jgi:hypothetical protein
VRVHVVDLVTGRPRGTFAVAAADGEGLRALWQPGGDAVIVTSGKGGLALWRPGAEVVRLGGAAFRAVFTHDGQQVLHVEDDPIARAARLVARAVEAPDEVIALSPGGSIVAAVHVMPASVLVELRSPGDDRRDLYRVAIGGRRAVLLEPAIERVIVEGDRALVLGRWNSQELTGDLRLHLADGGVRLVATAVADFDVGPLQSGRARLGTGASVLAVRRERLRSSREGLWAFRLP